MPEVDAATVGRTFRQESGRAVATLVRSFGDLDIAEEAVQEAFVEREVTGLVEEAFVVAVERWPVTGLPPNPGAWITTTARNKAIDRLRREGSRHHRQTEAVRLQDRDEPPAAEGPTLAA